MEPRCFITALGSQCEHYRSRVTLRCRARLCVATWVDWWRSVCLNAQRIKPSCLPRNSIRLRLTGRYACFARELRDYCDYPVAALRRSTPHSPLPFLAAPRCTTAGKVPAFGGKADIAPRGCHVWLLAQSRHHSVEFQSPLLGVKQTLI